MVLKRIKYNIYFTGFNSLVILYYKNNFLLSFRNIYVKSLLGSFSFFLNDFFNYSLYFVYFFINYTNFIYLLTNSNGILINFYYYFNFIDAWKFSLFQSKPKLNLFFNLFSKKSYNLILGLSEVLEISGHARSAKFVNNKRYILLQMGKSHYDKIYISKCVYLNIIANRLLRIYSYNIRYLKKLAYSIYKVFPADIYAGSGITLRSLNLVLKKRIIK